MSKGARSSVMILCVFVVVGLVIELIYKTPLDSYTLRPIGLMVVEGILLASSLWMLAIDSVWNNRLQITLRKILSGFLLAFVAWSVINVLGLIIEKPTWSQTWTSFVHSGSDVTPWLYVVAMFLFVGPGEEFLFRGYLFTRMIGTTDKTRKVVFAAVMSSMIFGLFHIFHDVHSISAGQMVGAFALQFLFGLFACYWYWRTQNMVYPIALHALFDLPVTQGLFQGDGSWLILGYLIIPFALVPFVRLASRPTIRNATTVVNGEQRSLR